MVAANVALAQRYELLTSMPGVGPVLAFTLIALLPELGKMSRKQIAALAALVPAANDYQSRCSSVGTNSGMPPACACGASAFLLRGFCLVRAIASSHSAELITPARSGVLWVIPIESSFAPK